MIVDLPRHFVRLAEINWDIDWGQQSIGGDVGGGDQPTRTAFPRFVGTLPLVLPPDLIPDFRALRWQLEGRVNVWRVPMVDPLTIDTRPAGFEAAMEAWRAGYHEEPRPKVRCVSAVTAGATSLLVDETLLGAQHRVRPGQILGYDDWPFVVLSRSGEGSAVTLTIKLLRTAIPANGLIDLEARGLFRVADPREGNPSYDVTRVARPQFQLVEWITR